MPHETRGLVILITFFKNLKIVIRGESIFLYVSSPFFCGILLQLNLHFIPILLITLHLREHFLSCQRWKRASFPVIYIDQCPLTAGISIGLKSVRTQKPG